jgi:hypothetical protein
LKKRRVLTPEEFCWYYAVGCLESRLAEGTIARDLYDIARKHISDRTLPPPELVHEIFPRPFEALGDRQTLAAMQEYWRVTHMSPKENTPVHRAEVVDLHPADPRRSGVWYTVSYTDVKTEHLTEATAHNTHGLPLRIGDRVYVHGHTIAEIDPEYGQ